MPSFPSDVMGLWIQSLHAAWMRRAALSLRSLRTTRHFLAMIDAALARPVRRGRLLHNSFQSRSAEGLVDGHIGPSFSSNTACPLALRTCRITNASDRKRIPLVWVRKSRHT